MKKQFSVSSVAALCVLAGLAAMPARATLEIRIGGTVSGGTVTGGTLCVDNTACDLDPTVGVLTTNSAFNIQVTGSTSTSGSPNGTLSVSFNGAPTAIGSVTFAVTDTGFNSPAPPVSLAQSDIATTQSGDIGSISAVGYFGATNVLFDTSGTHTTTATTPIGGAEAFGSGGPILSGSPYSLTDFITVSVTSLGTGINKQLQAGADLATAAVPEPASVALLGGILLFTVTTIRRKTRRA